MESEHIAEENLSLSQMLLVVLYEHQALTVLGDEVLEALLEDWGEIVPPTEA